MGEVSQQKLSAVSRGVGRVTLPAVEVAVAVAGGAFERIQRAFTPRRHKLPAAVKCVTADANSVVLETLPVSPLGGAVVAAVVPERVSHDGFCTATWHLNSGRVSE